MISVKGLFKRQYLRQCLRHKCAHDVQANRSFCAAATAALSTYIR